MFYDDTIGIMRAEIEELNLEIARLRNNEKVLLAAIADALKTSIFLSDVLNGTWKYNKYNFDSKIEVYRFALLAGSQDVRVPLLDAILELYGQEVRNKYQCHIEEIESRHDAFRAAAKRNDEVA